MSIMAGAVSVGDGEASQFAATTEGPLIAAIETGLAMPSAVEAAAPFLPAMTSPERKTQAVIAYGSILWSAVRGPTSQPDFIVLADDQRGWRRGLPGRLWSAVLPPSVYCLRVGQARAKVSVVTPRELVAETGCRAKDLHLAGRLSKRVALVWSRDEVARRRVVEAQRAALELMGRLTLSRFEGPFDLDAFLLALLALSYESEVRIVEPGKVAALLDVEREHYRTVATALLAALGVPSVDTGEARFQPRPWVRAQRGDAARLLRRSRRRSYLRWPKYLATYDGWLEYLEQKLARSGTPVSLSARQRRHPFVFALPLLFRMLRTRRVD